MSDKTKVYQGVRVRAPVRELLQKMRASQAVAKTTPIFPSQDGCTTVSAHHFDVCSGSAIPDNSPLQAYTYADSVYSTPTETSAFDNQFANIVLPADNINNILPPDSCAQHWSSGHFLTSSDYYSTGTTTSSSLDSVSPSFPSPVDYNSFSPPDSYSSSSSCYSSPSRVDSSYGSIAESFQCQHCSVQHCYCTPPWSGAQDISMMPEYSPYYVSDCLYTSMDQNYFRRDVSGPETCYL